jgi:glycosyltransferase involved in cell wall biosynthesis
MAMLDGPARESHLAVVGSPALGPGAYEAQLRAEASDLLGDRCRFTGPAEEVPSVLRSLDVVVNASTSEPFGLSILEAQACGVPVIGTDTGGIPEFVIDGETGLLFSPGRPDELAARLNRLLGAPGLGHDLAAAARRVVTARHTLSARADAVAGVYRELARTGAGVAAER